MTMNDNNGNGTLESDDVAQVFGELLRKQEEAFDKKLDQKLREQADMFQKKMQEGNATFAHKLQLTRIDRDTHHKALQAMATEKALLANVQRTRDLGENIKASTSAFNDTKDTVATAILALQTQVANIATEVGRFYDHNDLANNRGPAGSSLQFLRTQHDHIAGLIDVMERQANLTNNRQVKEASMACNCAHKTINESMASMRRRLTNVSNPGTPGTIPLQRYNPGCVN